MFSWGVAQRQVGLFVSVMVVLLGSAETHGQTDAPNSFYQKNFANAPKVGGEEMVAPEHAHVAPTKAPHAPQQNLKSSDSKVSAAIAPQAPNKKGEPRGIVTLYVSSQSRGHFDAAVRKAFRLAESNRNIKLGGIYHIGDYRNIAPSIESEAKSKGVVLLALQQVPPMWGVKDSPVWILLDSKGEHVIEGLLDIERCVSPQGEYREPERSMLETPAIPTIGVKSF